MFISPPIVQEIINNYKNTIITITFVKRTNGAIRTLTGRLGVSKYVSGKGMSYIPENYGLFTIYDMVLGNNLDESDRKRAYRCIGIDSVLEIKAGNKTYKGENEIIY